MNGPVPVEILHTEGCDNWEAARVAIYRVAEEVGATVEISETVVDSVETAESLRFVGSPTVRVGGQDIQSEVEQRTDFGLG
jgi:hypothetical protein